MKVLVGKRVQIYALKPLGSARLLHGLTATVVSEHPIATNWWKVRLDPNDVTEHDEWSISEDRLLVLEGLPLSDGGDGNDPVTN